MPSILDSAKSSRNVYLAAVIRMATVTLCLLGLWSGCKHDDRSTKSINSRTLIVFAFSAERDIEVGRITFSSGQAPILTITSQHPKAELLREAWEEIHRLPAVPLTRIVQDSTHPEAKPHAATTTISPEAENYFQAVMSYLERKYGFIVDIRR